MNMAAFFRAAAILIACLSVSSYLIFPSHYSAKEVLELKAQLTSLIPKTVEEVELAIQTLQEGFSASVHKLDAAFSSKADFASTIEPWINIGQDLLETLSTLSCLPLMVQGDSPLVGRFYGAVQSLESFIHDAIYDDKRFIGNVLSYSEDTSLNSLNNYQRYCLQQIVNKLCQNHFYSSESEMLKLVQLQVKLSTSSVAPFVYLQGEVAELQVAKPSLKLLTVNTCLMPGGLSFFYGGVKRWEDRIGGIIQKLQSVDADIVCLQEVHSEAAAAKLYQSLKGQYAHFYMNMGPRVFSTSLQDLGLNSGLFVASKYPLRNLHFEEFNIVGKQQEVNKGFFFASICANDQVLANLVTCHLEPFHADLAPKIRQKELLQIIDYVKTQDAGFNKAFILCGDFNIPWGKNEPGQAYLEEHFEDAFNQNRKKITVVDRTCTDYFTRCVMATAADLPVKGDGSQEILDYIVMFKNASSKNSSIKTQMVPFFDTKHPSKALSDHNGLLSEIKLP